ncbi:MAG: hypothetical protein ACFCVG_14515 [Kineosporiaceae bacterium]
MRVIPIAAAPPATRIAPAAAGSSPEPVSARDSPWGAAPPATAAAPGVVVAGAGVPPPEAAGVVGTVVGVVGFGVPGVPGVPGVAVRVADGRTGSWRVGFGIGLAAWAVAAVSVTALTTGTLHAATPTPARSAARLLTVTSRPLVMSDTRSSQISTPGYRT